MKNILITGANGGIGNAIAKKLMANGNRLLLIYNKHSENIDNLKLTSDINCEICTFKCDLTNSDEINALVSELYNKYKHIDALINSAGVSTFNQIQDVTENEYNFVLNSNLKSLILLTSAVAKLMISAQYGKIVNISSIWGKVGSSMESVYSASKGAINAFTLSLAKELGPSNINVNAVCPGLIDTAMNHSLSEETKKDIVNQTPISRIGTPLDVANLIEFLIDDKSSFITGQIICVDGGFSL